MPNLAESLQGRDLGHLHIVARFWGLEETAQDVDLVIAQLTENLLRASLVEKMFSSLPADAVFALEELAQHSGRMPWAQFSRAYGEIRQMGTARRDREQPYDQPSSATEVLWYRALIARAFFDSPAGPEEYAYIPEDMLKLIPLQTRAEKYSLGRQAAANEYTHVSLANDSLLDHACTYLAALRLGIHLPELFTSTGGEELTSSFLKSLLSSAGLIDATSVPLSEPVRFFLEAERGEALAQLFRAWKHSTLINELCLLPDLIVEGNWANDPVATRGIVLEYLATLPVGTWWGINSYISAIKQRNPDFQRPAGDYDSWFIRSKSSGEYLRGFSHWDEVDGRMVHFILTGPLHWLGILDLGREEEGQAVMAFRLSGWAKALMNEQAPKGIPAEEGLLQVRSDGRVHAGRRVPRRARYQVARFAEWEKETPNEYTYRLSAASLGQAREQGLNIGQLISILNHYAKLVPPSLVKALESWEKQGSLARVEKMVVLRVVSEDILQGLRKSRASRFLGEALSPTAVTVKPGAVDKVMSALAELGYLGEVRGEPD